MIALWLLLVMLGAIPRADEKPLLTVDELLEAVPEWPFGRSSTFDAIRRGDLPTIRMGRRVFLPTAALRRLLCVDEVAPDMRNGGPAA